MGNTNWMRNSFKMNNELEKKVTGKFKHTNLRWKSIIVKKKKQNVDILLRNLFYGILLVILSGLKQNYYENSHGNEDYWNHPHKFSQYMKKHFENAEFSKTLKKKHSLNE